MPEWVQNIIIGAAPLLTYIGGKWLVEWARSKKLNAEAGRITAATKADLVKMSDSMATKYMSLFEQAADELRQTKTHLDNAQSLIKEMMSMLKRNEVTGWEALEQKAIKLGIADG